MKKVISAIVMGLALGMMIIFNPVSAESNNYRPETTITPVAESVDPASFIGEEKALAIGLQDAHVTQDDAYNVHVQTMYESDNETYYYDVNFCGHGHKYGYLIDATTGRIAISSSTR